MFLINKKVLEFFFDWGLKLRVGGGMEIDVFFGVMVVNGISFDIFLGKWFYNR